VAILWRGRLIIATTELFFLKCHNHVNLADYALLQYYEKPAKKVLTNFRRICGATANGALSPF